MALGIIWYLINKNRDNFAKFEERQIEWQYFALGMVTCLISVVATMVRWYLLVWAQQFPFKFRDALRLGFLGYMFNYVAPGSIGGDVVKAAMLVRQQKERRLVAASTVILDRMLGLVSLMAVGAGASFFAPADIASRGIVNKVVWGGTLIGGGLLLVLLHPVLSHSKPVLWMTRIPKIGPGIADLSAAATLYQSRRLVILLGVIIGILGQFGVISSFYFCARAISSTDHIPSYVTHILLIPIAELIGVIVPTPGGMGGLEGAVEESYKMAHYSPALGLMAALGYRLITIIVACIGGIYYAISRAEIREVLANEDAESASDKSAPAAVS
jgi:hypothetical protein